MLGRLFSRNRNSDEDGQPRGERGGFFESILEMLGIEAEFGGDDDRDRGRNDDRRRRRRDDEADSMDF